MPPRTSCYHKDKILISIATGFYRCADCGVVMKKYLARWIRVDEPLVKHTYNK